MKNILKLIILIILLIIPIIIFYDYYNKIILITEFIIIFLIISLIVYLIIKGLRTKKQSTIIFLERIDRNFKNKNNDVNKVFDFNRRIKYEKKIIPLGKLVIDNVYSRILLYETFYNKNNFFVCLPDIRVIKQEKLRNCYITKSGEKITILELDEYFHRVKKKKRFYKDISLTMKFKQSVVELINLQLSSINDYELFRNIYLELEQIVNENKK